VYVNNTLEASKSISVSEEDDTEPLTPVEGSKQFLLTDLGNMVAQGSIGYCFGEFALIHPDSRRFASVVACDSDTVVIVIGKADYHKFIREAQEKEFHEKMDFVNSIGLMSNWRNRAKELLSMSLKIYEGSFGERFIMQNTS